MFVCCVLCDLISLYSWIISIHLLKDYEYKQTGLFKVMQPHSGVTLEPPSHITYMFLSFKTELKFY